MYGAGMRSIERVLMGPGPSDVPARVLEALSRPTIGHLDPVFLQVLDETQAMLRQVFGTENPLTLPMSATGSAGMETCFVNLLEPGDHALICRNGVFGGRMKENVERCGATAVLVEDAWGEPVNVEKVAAAFEQHPDVNLLAILELLLAVEQVEVRRAGSHVLLGHFL